MRTIPVLLAACATACSFSSAPVTVDPTEATPDAGDGKADGGSPTTAAIPDVTCAGLPDAGPSKGFRHLGSKITSALGDPRHRGIDLVASASADTQVLEGAVSYGVFDKALEDEDVDVFACRAGAWVRVGTPRTDGEGNFALSLSGGARLPIALRDLAFSVVGDRTEVGFLGFVGPDASPLAVSDVDGTLTSSEGAFAATILLGLDIANQPDAPAALTAITHHGFQPVYLTARGQSYTGATRAWLVGHGFPRGPLRLAPGLITLPGQETADFKAGALADLQTAGMDVEIGIGNRATDIDAYATVGVSPDRTWVKLPEYADELADDLAAHKAIGFETYADLEATLLPAL